jgi:spore germination cell wall hydrolase CwlJ-like protein
MITRFGLRSIAALGLLALIGTTLVPLFGADRLDARANAITIALDPARPFQGDTDPMLMLAAARQKAMSADASDAQLGALVEAGLKGDTPAAPIAATIPASFFPGTPATPYLFRSRSPVDNLRASLCLTAAIYYEAGNEPDEGQRAVAQVVLNRVRHPAFPKTVCDVVYQGTEKSGVGCQFTFGCDGAFSRTPALASWIRARRVAQAALSGSVYAPIGFATHYHTMAVSPAWDSVMTPAAIIGAHIFYRMPGGAGEPRAFSGRYLGHEPIPGPRAKIIDPNAPPVIMAGIGTGPALTSPLPTTPAAIQWVDPAIPAKAATQAPVTQVSTLAPTRRVAEDKRYLSGTLPESDVRPEYARSGTWIGR